MPRQPRFRCVQCVDLDARCDACRAVRAADLRARRHAKKLLGKCVECQRKAMAGYTRCKLHNAANNRNSSASHARSA